MTRRIVLVITLFAFAGAALAAPNFSGQWKINASKSKTAGDFPLPEKFERKITHAEPNVQATTVRSGFQGGGEVTTESKYTTDGKETSNPGFGGSTMKSTAKWEGDVLVISSTASTDNGDFKISERWSLSADGKTLEIANKVSGGFGEFESKYVMDKQ